MELEYVMALLQIHSNRTFMELKSRYGIYYKLERNLQSHLYGIEILLQVWNYTFLVFSNRTFMELKFDCFYFVYHSAKISNRTYMELKSRT